MTREEKLAAFGELTKIPGVKTGRVYADELEDAVQILVSHAAAGRPWRIVGPDAVPGFWHLESSVQLGKDYYNERRITITSASLTNVSSLSFLRRTLPASNDHAAISDRVRGARRDSP
jgi:hypothetical protein